MSLDARGYFENPAHPEEPAATASSSAAELDGPLVIPGLYDGRNKTFFMVAYEGVRGEAIAEPVRLRPDGAHAPGELLRGHARRSGTRSPGSRSRATSSRSRCSRRRRIELLQYYPAPNRAGTANNLQGRARNDGQRSTSSWPRRSEPRQQGPAEPPLQLARQLQQQSLERGDPGHGGHPAAREQELAVRLHPHAAAEPATTTSGSATTASTSTR